MDRSRVEWFTVGRVAHADLFCPTRPPGGRWVTTPTGETPEGLEVCDVCAYAIGHEATHPLV